MVDNKVPSVNPKHVPITIPIGSAYSTSICPNPEPITFSVILAASLDFCFSPLLLQCPSVQTVEWTPVLHKQTRSSSSWYTAEVTPPKFPASSRKPGKWSFPPVLKQEFSIVKPSQEGEFQMKSWSPALFCWSRKSSDSKIKFSFPCPLTCY